MAKIKKSFRLTEKAVEKLKQFDTDETSVVEKAILSYNEITPKAEKPVPKGEIMRVFQ